MTTKLLTKHYDRRDLNVWDSNRLTRFKTNINYQITGTRPNFVQAKILNQNKKLTLAFKSSLGEFALQGEAVPSRSQRQKG